MNAVPKQKSAPRTAEQLAAELADLERQLHEVRRMENAARSELPRHIVAGDTQAVAQGREDIALCEKRIKELTAAIESAREAARLASERDRGKLNTAAYRTVRRLVADQVAAIEQLEGAVQAFAGAYFAAEEGLEAVASAMRQAGVEPDRYLLSAKLHGITDRALHLETRGFFGRARTLDSPDELRRSGAASLVHAGREWQAVTLRQVRHALQIPEET